MKHGFVAEHKIRHDRHEQIFSHSFGTKHGIVNIVWFRLLQNLKPAALQFQALSDDFPRCRLRNADSPISISCRLPLSPHYRFSHSVHSRQLPASFASTAAVLNLCSTDRYQGGRQLGCEKKAKIYFH